MWVMTRALAAGLDASNVAENGPGACAVGSLFKTRSQPIASRLPACWQDD